MRTGRHATETRAARPEGPTRRCVATGATSDRAALVRFVRGPDGVIVPDLAARLPGRGVWVAARREAVERARRRGLFARDLGAGLVVDPDLEVRVEALLARHALDLVGLAKRAGMLGAGLEAVRAMAASGEIGLVLAASDGAAGGRAKLARLVQDAPVATVFSAAELGQALGRDNAVQVAVRRGGIAERISREVARLAGFRALGDDVRLTRE